MKTILIVVLTLLTLSSCSSHIKAKNNPTGTPIKRSALKK